jgi:hypothetical protein
MQLNNNPTQSNNIRMIFIILGLHILLLLGVGTAVILIKGIYELRWVLLAIATALICLSAYVFYQRFKTDKQQISRMMSNPALRGRSVEISLLGGIASIKLGHQGSNTLQLEAQGPKPLVQIDELSRLKQMLDEGLLDFDEFQQLKKEVLNNQRSLPPATPAIEQLQDAATLTESTYETDAGKPKNLPG